MKNQEVQERKFVNRISIPIRWVDMDAYGHVNNARFFDCMTEARAALLKELMPLTETCQFILIDTHCNFKRPYTYPDTIVIDQFVETIGMSSFTFYYQFSVEREPTTIYATGTAKMVCFNPKLGRAIKVPSEALALLTS